MKIDKKGLVNKSIIFGLVIWLSFGMGVRATRSLTSVNVATVPEGKIVTLDNDNKTITLQVNETFLLKLGEDYYWNITIDDQTIISRVPNVLVVRGSQGIYRAHDPGGATLTAYGKPICPPGQLCPQLVRMFRLYIVVTAPTATPTVALITPTFYGFKTPQGGLAKNC